ncbi:hypothetical protein K435DRAFT_750017 [Dendrothele bispora CBS 962.96]|uniref:Concanavalin A-like lectin/glucanase n=1 Tax=Dendrothele bispora (strain CBS 962.96) TaxID=1314807 RepID=A0A4S8MH55_DENBC|nr:hypothetical protein K435DRAFT_750017 [Dendrothele bispora CBS 962.96]
MFSFRFFSLLICSALLSLVSAQNWYTVEWDAPTFTAMSGDMIVPKLPQPGGTPYVWPGVQSGNGVLQAVLDGRSGTWWIGDGFFGTPSLPWGNGFNVNPGDTVHFTFSLSGTTWTCTLSSNGKSASTSLNITGNTMNRAIFAAELYDVPFNFGPIVYRNVKITASTPASQWCGGIAHLGSYPFTVSGNTASGNTCNIASITQNNA